VFAGSYFPRHYFAARYFPDGGDAVVPPADGGDYFADRYFAPRYFGAGYWGPLEQVEPPAPPPSVGVPALGGGPRRRGAVVHRRPPLRTAPAVEIQVAPLPVVAVARLGAPVVSLALQPAPLTSFCHLGKPAVAVSLSPASVTARGGATLGVPSLRLTPSLQQRLDEAEALLVLLE
jgi:hypothetical protein